MYFACVHYLIERNENYIDTSSTNSTDLHGLTSVQNLQHDILSILNLRPPRKFKSYLQHDILIVGCIAIYHGKLDI